jgi:hypothetical protein
MQIPPKQIIATDRRAVVMCWSPPDAEQVKLHRYFPGAIAELAEQRKTKAYSRLWNVESERARVIFFPVELSGCFGPEAQQMCKTVVEMGGGGPEALREVYESLSIGFQVNRALRINT